MGAGWVIWKYELPIDRDQFSVAMPAAFNLSLQVQNGVPVLWAAVMPDTAEEGERRPHTYVWVATGKRIPDSVLNFTQSFRGTVQLPNGLVLHLFEIFGY